MKPEKEIVDLTKRLIRFESTEHRPEKLIEIIQFAKTYLQKAGCKVKTFNYHQKPSLYASFKRSKKPTILFNGHLDVVPGQPGQFKPQIKSGKLIGRGAQDMKAATAVFMVLFKTLAQKTPSPSVGLMLVTDEEIGGGPGTQNLIGKGYIPKFAIFGEPTDEKLEIEAKGILRLKLETKGKTAHGAYPWEGDNAIYKLAKALTKLEKLYPPKNSSWKTSVNLANISGGTKVINQVPDYATATLDVRRLSTDSTSSIVNKIKKITQQLKVTVESDNIAHSIDTNNKHYLALKQVLTRVLKQPAKTAKKPGGSDARFYTKIGIPAVCFGPKGNGLHSNHEWVDINSLETYYQTLLQFTQSL